MQDIDVLEFECEPDPDYERIGMRQCARDACDTWFPFTRTSHIYCDHCGALDLRTGRKGDRHKPGTGDRHKPRTGDRHKTRYGRQPAQTRPFIGVDGEGAGTNEIGQQNYLLMQARGTDDFSDELFKDNAPLTTRDCLEFILSLPYDAILVAFYFDYNATPILRDLNEIDIGRILTEDDGRGRAHYTWWPKDAPEDPQYAIDYKPQRYFRVARLARDPETGKLVPQERTSRTINEVGRYFQKRFVDAVTDWQVADPATLLMIERNKNERARFEQITAEIRGYCEMECRLLAAMMEKFRTRLIEGTAQIREELQDDTISLVPQAYQGPGYISSRLLGSTKTPKRTDLPTLPVDFQPLVVEAYYGGRAEISRTGYIEQKIYGYDINSAYPAAMLQLPCPVHTQWHKAAKPSPGSLFLANLSFIHDPKSFWGGFPFRGSDGLIYFPLQGSGVYWSIEIEAACRIGARVKFHEVWQADRCCDCKSYPWINQLYSLRTRLGKTTEGVPLKLGMNSLYGKTAQRRGTAPYQNYIHAGLIGAGGRVKLLQAVAGDPEAVVMLATDAVYSTRPLKLDLSAELGAWRDTEYPDMFIVQPGLYWFPGMPETNGSTLKTRGIPASIVRQNADKFRDAWDCYMQDNMKRRLIVPRPFLDEFNVTVPMQSFVGLRLAMEKENRSLAGQWHTIEKQISFDWRSKRGSAQIEGWTVRHVPHPGDVAERSRPYDPEKPVRSALLQTLEVEALPDYVPILEQ
jgi:hypothetical protein